MNRTLIYVTDEEMAKYTCFLQVKNAENGGPFMHRTASVNF